MTALAKLRKFLLELFRLHSAELGCGVHRIIKERSDAMAAFLDHGLPAQTRAVLCPGYFVGEHTPTPSPEKAFGTVASSPRSADMATCEERVYHHVHIFFSCCHRARERPGRQARTQDISLLSQNREEVGIWWVDRNRYYVRTTGNVSRKTSDRFIHKDLGGALHRELNQYIKDHVLLTDTAETTISCILRSHTIARAVHSIGSTLISFLAEPAEFQKKCWLKKKFVLETHYCLTLDRIPECFYPEIAANDLQREEWVRVAAIHEVEDPPCYSVPLTAEFLTAHPSLMLDTRFFPEEFTWRLMLGIEEFFGSCNGLLIRGEASQALRLIQKAYHDGVDCVVIDPPYNTGNNGFSYKDTLRSSSWLTMMEERVSCCPRLLKKDGLFAAAIDDHELHHLGMLLNSIFGEDNRVACAPWKSEPSGGKEKTGLRTGHEYVLMYHNGDASAISRDERSTGTLNLRDRLGPYRKGRELRKWGGISSRDDRPNQWYPLNAPDGEKVYPIKNDGTEGHWRWGKRNESIKAALKDPEEFHWEKCPFDYGVTHLGNSERWVPFEKIRATKKSVGWATWLDSCGSNADGTRTLKNLFAKKMFDTPKPVQLCKWIVSLHDNRQAQVLDFFAGSGTTAHAVIDLNREDGGKRTYVLVEMGDEFDSVMKPRIQKTVYARDWKNGKPLTRNSGVSHMFKYIRIESYEDCLNNVVQPDDERTVASEPDMEIVRNRVGYVIRKDPSGITPELRVRPLVDPVRVKLTIKSHDSDEGSEIPVDLIETFNYLIGLKVSAATGPQSFSATFPPNPRGKTKGQAILKKDPRGLWRFRSIVGKTPDGAVAMVIWRTLTRCLAEDNHVLNAWFRLADPGGLQTVYVNGPNDLEHVKPANDSWNIRIIEDELQRTLWAADDG